MSDYQFSLERGGMKHVCPACNQRKFVRYLDTETGEYLADEVGRCDREDSCGYHLKPKEHFLHGGKRPTVRSKVSPMRKLKPEPSFFPPEIMQASLKNYNDNHFYQWLVLVFGEKKALELTLSYRIGSAHYWKGSCIFWQIDDNGYVRSGKVMLYDAMTGRRVKEPYNHIQWAHKLLQIEPFNLSQCLFGLHLLTENRSKPIAVVESEKTAIVGAGFMPDFIWMATASKSNLNAERLKPLYGREVVLYPDLGALDDWRKVADSLPGVTVSYILEKQATDEDRKAGLDVADFLLREQNGSRRASADLTGRSSP